LCDKIVNMDFLTHTLINYNIKCPLALKKLIGGGLKEKLWIDGSTYPDNLYTSTSDCPLSTKAWTKKLKSDISKALEI